MNEPIEGNESASGSALCYAGTRLIDSGGGVAIGCITPEAHDLLDDVMASYGAHYNAESHTATPDQVYQFAYWLIRWSGLVRRAALPRREPDERKGGALWLTCPGCGLRDNTGIDGEVLTGVVTCGHCGTTSCNSVSA